jgi:transposase
VIETADLLLENQILKEELLQVKEKSESEIAYLKYQLDQLKRQIFGVKSERFLSMLHAGQLALPIEEENPPVIEKEETILVEAHDRKKKKKKENHPLRKPFPAHLPREVEKIYPQGFDENSPEKPIGEEVTEILEEIPGKFFVKQLIRYKFANKETGGVVIGELPSRVNEKGMFGELLLTRIIIDKYCDHLPGYRQEQRFTRAGIKIPYSTLMDVPRQVGNYMVPLYEELKKQSLECKYLQIDETPHPVQDKETKGKTHRGYLWVYRSVEQRLVLFEYSPGRGTEWPKEILKDYKGFIQTDGYKVYDYFDRRADITSICCMAHARRYFEKALKEHKELAEYFITKLQAVYAVEKEIRDENKSEEEIIFLRKEKSLPILNELEKWLKENTYHPPRSPIAQAVAYTLSRWKKLTVYIEHPFLEIDNNLVENAIRPTVLGRKNYLFSGSHESAQRAAMFYSFFGSCKINDVNPQEWLADVLLKLPETKTSELYTLLPTYWKNNK